MAGLPLGIEDSPTRFPSRTDTAFLILIAVITLLTRWGSHVNHSINADESQYAAQASYLLSANKSPFETPIGPVHGNAIYALFTRAFGEYQFIPIRVTASLITGACAMALYVFARRIVAPPGAILAALMMVLWSLYFEGWSANREWFALPLGLLGIGCYASTFALGNENLRGRYVLSGLFCGLAALPKDQALFFSLIPAIDILLRGSRDNDAAFILFAWRHYFLGFLVAVGAYLLPFLMAGTLQDHLEFLWSFRMNQYIASKIGGHDTVGRVESILEYLYVSMPGRRLFGVALAVAFVSLASALRHIPLVDSRSLLLHPRVRLASVYFLVSAAAVQVGSRFFLHYYLFWIPAVSVLVAVGLVELIRSTDARPGRSWLLLFAAGVFLLDAWFVREPIPWLHASYWHLVMACAGMAIWFACRQRLAPPGLVLCQSPEFGLGVFRSDQDHPLVAAQPGQQVVRATRNLRLDATLGRVLLTALLAGEIVLLTAATILHADQVVSRGVDRPRISSLVRYFDEHAEPSDTLFVWGWRPEIYTESRLIAGTPFATGMEIMRDTFGAPAKRPSPNERHLEQLMRTLRDRPPRYVVDAWPISINGATYRLKFIPLLRSWLEDHYDHVATLDGCAVYEWVGTSSKRTVQPPGDDLESVLRWMDENLREHPHDVACLLNKADALYQEGRLDEAREIYERIGKLAPRWPVIRDRLRLFPR